MVKIFVDTNVISEWGRELDKLVKCKNGTKDEVNFYGFNFKNKDDFDIIIPQIVTDELDGLKKNTEDNIGYKSRK
jgi:rRNA-processing protein FCF1